MAIHCSNQTEKNCWSKCVYTTEERHRIQDLNRWDCTFNCMKKKYILCRYKIWMAMAMVQNFEIISDSYKVASICTRENRALSKGMLRWCHQVGHTEHCGLVVMSSSLDPKTFILTEDCTCFFLVTPWKCYLKVSHDRFLPNHSRSSSSLIGCYISSAVEATSSNNIKSVKKR